MAIPNAPNEWGPIQRGIFGLLFLGAGLLPALAAFDIGPLDSHDIHGPPWIGIAIGGIFMLAGLIILAGQLPPLANSVLTLIMSAGFAALANWIAFGAGERFCSASISLSFLWGDGELSGLGCRIPFGAGALAVNGMFVVLAAKTLQQALGGPPQIARWVRAAEWFLLATLAPILLPLLLYLVLRASGEAVLTRFKTGQWPRNEQFIARQLKRVTAKLK